MSLILNLRYGIQDPSTIKYHTVSLKSTGMGVASTDGVGDKATRYAPQENEDSCGVINHDGPVTRWLNRRRQRWPFGQRWRGIWKVYFLGNGLPAAQRYASAHIRRMTIIAGRIERVS
jgi:DMSO/TMAO reductase YedYZ molybdopterin-dependent catalytic subunit